MTRRLTKATERKCKHCLRVFLTSKNNIKKVFCLDECKVAFYNAKRKRKHLEKDR